MSWFGVGGGGNSGNGVASGDCSSIDGVGGTGDADIAVVGYARGTVTMLVVVVALLVIVTRWVLVMVMMMVVIVVMSAEPL